MSEVKYKDKTEKIIAAVFHYLRAYRHQVALLINFEVKA